ncbi:MAG: hypothetical protein IJ389_04435 [Clostridia bacterium]|nr:hypothetical protein [Clostridia bacterium]
MKGKKSLWAGILMLAVCLFEIGTVKNYIADIAGGEVGYIAELLVEAIYLAGIVGAAVTLIRDKVGKATVGFLALSCGVGLYNAASYVAGIMGNSMKLSLVAANVIEMVELLLFATPLAIMILSAKKLSDRAYKGFVIAQICAFAVRVGAVFMFFVGYGKNIILDMGLLFQVYWSDLLLSVVCLGAFMCAAASLAPHKRKKQR